MSHTWNCSKGHSGDGYRLDCPVCKTHQQAGAEAFKEAERIIEILDQTEDHAEGEDDRHILARALESYASEQVRAALSGFTVWHNCGGQIKTYPRAFCSKRPHGADDRCDFDPLKELASLKAAVGPLVEALTQIGDNSNWYYYDEGGLKWQGKPHARVIAENALADFKAKSGETK